MRLGRPLAVAVVLALTTLGGSARADRAEELRACSASSERGQVLRGEGKLIEAAAELLACSKLECPEQIRPDCERWYREVTESVPTVVVAVRDASGGDVLDARISVDGHDVSGAVSGHAFPVDPGPHVVSIVRATGERAEQSFMVREGEKLRTLAIVLRPPEGAGAPPPPAPVEAAKPPPEAPRDVHHPSRAPVLGYVLLGVSALALGTSAFFFFKQSASYDDLDHTCAPHCDRSSAQAIDDERLVAGISGGVAVAAAVAGAWLLFSSSRTHASSATGSGPRVHPVASATGAGLRLTLDY